MGGLVGGQMEEQVGRLKDGETDGQMDGKRVDGQENVFQYFKREEMILRTIWHKYNGAVRKDNSALERSK